MNKKSLYLLIIISLLSFIFRFFVFNQPSNLLSATISSLTPLAIYLLIISINPKTTKIGLLSALILATNPLNLHFSNTSQWQYNLYPLILILVSIIIFKIIKSQNIKFLLNTLLLLTIPVYILATIIINRELINLYFTFLSPKFLVFQGDWQNIQQFAPYTGIILFPTFTFLLIGLFSKSKYKTQKKYFLLWLILSPIPAVSKSDSTSLSLLLSYSIPLIYFASLGITNLYNVLYKQRHKQIFVISIIFIFLISFIYYSDLYINHLFK